MRAALDGRGGVGRRPRRDGTGSVGAGGAAPAAREPGPMRRGRVAPRVGQEPWGVRSWPCAHRWGEWAATSTIPGNAVLGPGAGPPRRRARKGDVSRAAWLLGEPPSSMWCVECRRSVGCGPDGRVGSGASGGVDDRGQRCAAVGRVRVLRWGGSAVVSARQGDVGRAARLLGGPSSSTWCIECRRSIGSEPGDRAGVAGAQEMGCVDRSVRTRRGRGGSRRGRRRRGSRPRRG